MFGTSLEHVLGMHRPKVDIDSATQNRWILGDRLPGVEFRMLQQVVVQRGAHAGLRGELISIYSSGADPLFHLELLDGGDLYVRQSELLP